MVLGAAPAMPAAKNAMQQNARASCDDLIRGDPIGISHRRFGARLARRRRRDDAVRAADDPLHRRRVARDGREVDGPRKNKSNWNVWTTIPPTRFRSPATSD